MNVTGNLYAGDFTPTNLVVGVSTVSSSLHVGSALTSNAAGDVETIGIITAASFSGDGSALTGLANTAYIVSVATTTGDLKVGAAVTVGGIVNIDATTDSTSSTTGALIVDGGLGVAKNVYIGAGLSVAGTLTYEDVTSVDSVGLITAKSGVNITGGQLTVGSGITMGIAGVATFSGTSDVHLLDNIKLNVGDGSDLEVYHDGSHSHIVSNTGNLRILADGAGDLVLTSKTGEEAIVCAQDGAVTVKYDNATKLTTTNDGTVTTGIGTFTAGISLNADDKKITVGVGSDLAIYHDGSHSFISNQHGTGNIVMYGNGTNSIVLQPKAGENSIIANSDSSVNLYYNNSEKFQTTNDGVVITGICTADGLRLGDNESIKVGNDGDLELKHDGSDSWIRDTGTGRLNIDGSQIQFRKYGVSEVMANFIQDAQVELYYNNSKKFETFDGGTLTTGIGSFSTQIKINTNGTSIAENNLNFACSGIAYIDHRTVGKNITFRMSSGSALDTNAIIVGATGITTFSDTPHDDLGNLRDIPLRSVTGSAATLVVGDAGKVVSTNTTGWTVPASTFDEGDTVTLLNNSAGGLVITCSAVTTYLTTDGSTVTSSTLGARGLATLYFVSSSVAYLQGTALS